MKKIRTLIIPSTLAILLAACASTSTKQPQNADDYWKEAKTHSARGNLPAAIKSLDQAIRLDPNKAEYYAYRAHKFAEQNELASASQDVDKALSLAPNNASALFDRSQIYFYQGKLPEALNAIDQALNIDAKNHRYLGMRCVERVASNQPEAG